MGVVVEAEVAVVEGVDDVSGLFLYCKSKHDCFDIGRTRFVVKCLPVTQVVRRGMWILIEWFPPSELSLAESFARCEVTHH